MIHNIAKSLNNKPPKKCFKKCIKFSHVSIPKTFIDQKKKKNGELGITTYFTVQFLLNVYPVIFNIYYIRLHFNTNINIQ